MADPGAVGQRWRQVLADVGYLRRELRRLGPREAYVRRALTFDEASIRDVAAFERIYERLANELDHLVRDYLMRRAANAQAQTEVENASATSVFDVFATAQRLPIASKSSLRRAAMARNALQHDYLNVRASDVFDGATELLTGVDAILAAVRVSWNELGIELPQPPSAGPTSTKQ